MCEKGRRRVREIKRGNEGEGERESEGEEKERGVREGERGE